VFPEEDFTASLGFEVSGTDALFFHLAGGQL